MDLNIFTPFIFDKLEHYTQQMSAQRTGTATGNAMVERCSNSQEIFVGSNRQVEKIAVAIRQFRITTMILPDNARQVGENLHFAE